MDFIRSTDPLRAGFRNRLAWATAFEAFDGWATRREKWLLAILVIWSIARYADWMPRRFDGDEMFTFHISSLASIDDVIHAVPADGNPPLYYLLAGVSLRLLGATEIATRLPATVAFIVASLALYGFVRHRCPPVAALFALLAFNMSVVGEYAVEARPYTLVLAFTAIALVSWQRAAERTSQRALPLAGLAFGVAGAIASHHFGALTVAVPLLCGEAWRLVQRRRFDLPVYLAGLAGASMLLATVPLMEQTHAALLAHVRDSAVFFGKPALKDIAAWLAMTDFRLLAAFAVSVVFVTWLVPQSPSEPVSASIPGHEIAAAVGLAMLVPIVLAVAWLATGYFQTRYAMGSAIGIAVLLGFAIGSHWGTPRRGTMAALVCLAVLGAGFALEEARQLVAMARGRHMATYFSDGATVLTSAPMDKPIVIGSAAEYPVLWWYATPEQRAKFHYLSDLSYGVRQRDPMGELTLVAEQPFIPSKVVDYGAFLSKYQDFYLHCTLSADGTCDDETTWIMGRLLSEGYHLTLVSTTAVDLLFHVVLK